MSDSYEQIETRIQAAIAFILPGTKPNIMKKAQDFAVSETRLRACYKELKNRSNCGEADHVLTDAQEQALILIIKHEEADGTYLRHWQLQDRANWILLILLRL